MKATRSALFTLQNTLLAAGLALILCSPTFGADSESAPAESMATVADNSAMNIRDRDGDTMTPLDQSNQQGDVEITRAIRKGLVGDDSLGDQRAQRQGHHGRRQSHAAWPGGVYCGAGQSGRDGEPSRRQ